LLWFRAADEVSYMLAFGRTLIYVVETEVEIVNMPLFLFLLNCCATFSAVCDWDFMNRLFNEKNLVHFVHCRRREYVCFFIV